jgi:cytochrome c-type biogenesis protein CcmE
VLVLACGVGLGSATALGLSAVSSSLVYFVSPSTLDEHAAPGRLVRLGGLVEQGSVRKGEQDGVPLTRFTVTDGRATVPVTFRGVLPDLFREGQGVVTMGTLAANGTFRASEVLAKHDANYMPKDVVDALKKSGRWNPASGPPPPAATWDAMVVKGKG